MEVAGVRLTDGSEIVRGTWVVTNISPSAIDLVASIWQGGGVSYQANTGIVRLHALAVAQRASLLSGDLTNGSVPPITNLATAASSNHRGYAQGLTDFRAWLEAHTDATPGYYISGSAVGTTHAVLERGTQAGYPFALTPMDKDFTNGWEIASSQTNAGILELTIAAGKTPPANWVGKVRVALFGHSNTSYCIDQHLDKGKSTGSTGGSGLRRLNGFNGTATAAGTTTTLTDGHFTFPNWLNGCELYMEDGPNAGLTRTIKSVSANTITVASAFPSAIASGNKYRAGHLSFPVTSVAGQAIRLATPYRFINGTGGALMVMGRLATTGNSVTKGNSRPGGGDYTRFTMESDHGLAAGNFVVVLGTTYPGRLHVKLRSP